METIKVNKQTEQKLAQEFGRVLIDATKKYYESMNVAYLNIQTRAYDVTNFKRLFIAEIDGVKYYAWGKCFFELQVIQPKTLQHVRGDAPDIEIPGWIKVLSVSSKCLFYNQERTIRYKLSKPIYVRNE